jgi:hypothetical protein
VHVRAQHAHALQERQGGWQKRVSALRRGCCQSGRQQTGPRGHAAVPGMG